LRENDGEKRFSTGEKATPKRGGGRKKKKKVWNIKRKILKEEKVAAKKEKKTFSSKKTLGCRMKRNQRRGGKPYRGGNLAKRGEKKRTRQKPHKKKGIKGVLQGWSKKKVGKQQKKSHGKGGEGVKKVSGGFKSGGGRKNEKKCQKGWQLEKRKRQLRAGNNLAVNEW